jgi:two-component system, chemotaxis family, CheB/CheR fusion protein
VLRKIPKATPLESTAQAPVARENPLRVLVVEDNVDAAESLRMLLTMMGHRAHTLHSGMGAPQAAAEHQPDVLLLDIGLPGLAGYQVAEQVRRTPGMEGVVLVAMTGYGQDEDHQKSKRAGFDYHLVKPVDLRWSPSRPTNQRKNARILPLEALYFRTHAGGGRNR